MPTHVSNICDTGSGGGTGNLAAVSIPGGNTSGVIGVISSGTVYLAGGNNVTLSQNGQSITISAGASGGGGLALSLSGNTSGALALISTGTAILAGGNNVTLSQNGQSVTISAANQSNQTVGLYASSNTYLTSSGTVDARSLTFRGDKSITVGISNGEVAFSVGAYLTTAMASNRGSDFVQATAAFNGTNASGTIASNNISVSVATPVPIATTVNPVASANSTGTVTRYAPEDHRHAGIAAIGISTAGNSAGTSGSNVGSYWFQGGNSITLSQITSNNGSHTIIVSAGNYLTTAMASNRGSDFVQATAVFNGTNASGTIASGAISVSVAAAVAIATSVNPVASASSVGTVTRYAPEDHRHAGIGGVGISTSGNTAGTTGSVVGTYWFEGGNSITVSQITSNNGSHTLRISAGNYLTTAALSGDTTKYVQAWELTGNTAGTTSSLQGTKIYFDGGNNITVSGNSNTIRISAFTQTVQSAIKGFGVSNTGTTAGNTGISTGIDWVIAGSGNITASESTTAGGPNTVWLSVATAAPSPVNFSAGTTSNNLGSVVFSNSNGISFGLNGSTITANATRGFYAAGNTTDNTSATFDLRSMTVNAQNASGCLTVGFSNGSMELSGASTVGTATTAFSVASDNSVGTVTRWAAEDHRHAGVGGVGISTAGNTAGTTGSQLGTYWFQGGNNITLSQITSNNGSHTLVISGKNDIISFYEPFDWNMAASATTTYGSQTLFLFPLSLQAPVSFDRVHMIASGSLGTVSAANTITASFATSGQSQAFSLNAFFSNSNLVNLFLFSKGATGGSTTDLKTYGSTQLSFVTFHTHTLSHVATCASSSVTQSLTSSQSLIVSYPGISSGTVTSVNAATTVTTWQTGYTSWTSTATNSTSSAGTSNATKTISIASTYPATTGWSSNKLIVLPFATSMSEGQWWLGFNWSSSTSSAISTSQTSIAAGRSYSTAVNASNLTMSNQLTWAGFTNTLASSLGFLGVQSSASMAPSPGHGTYSATYAATKTFMNNAGQANGEIALSDIATVVSFWKPWVQLASNRI